MLSMNSETPLLFSAPTYKKKYSKAYSYHLSKKKFCALRLLTLRRKKNKLAFHHSLISFTGKAPKTYWPSELPLGSEAVVEGHVVLVCQLYQEIFGGVGVFKFVPQGIHKDMD